ASLSKGPCPVAGFVGREPAKAVLVPAEDGSKVALVLGVIDHPTELEPLLGVVTGYGVVGVPAKDAVAVLVGVLLDRLALVQDARILLIRRASKIADRRGQGRSRVTAAIGLGRHDRDPLCRDPRQEVRSGRRGQAGSRL